MKKIIAGFLLLLVINGATAQVSDTAVRAFNKYFCNCIDTLDMQRPEAELRKQTGLCKTLSLTRLLNMKLITPELLTNEQQATELEQKSFALLAKECEGVKRLMRAFSKEPAARESNESNLFIPVGFFKTYQLEKGETNERLHVYNNLQTGEQKYQRAVDIRWTFETEEEALKWHQLKLKENSEGGVPIKDLIVIEGAQQLKVYREGKQGADLLKALGIVQRHHYFLFVYKNIVCKIFVATDGSINTMDLVPFAAAAVKQLKEAVK